MILLFLKLGEKNVLDDSDFSDESVGPKTKGKSNTALKGYTLLHCLNFLAGFLIIIVLKLGKRKVEDESDFSDESVSSRPKHKVSKRKGDAASSECKKDREISKVFEAERKAIIKRQKTLLKENDAKKMALEEETITETDLKKYFEDANSEFLILPNQYGEDSLQTGVVKLLCHYMKKLGKKQKSVAVEFFLRKEKAITSNFGNYLTVMFFNMMRNLCREKAEQLLLTNIDQDKLSVPGFCVNFVHWSRIPMSTVEMMYDRDAESENPINLRVTRYTYDSKKINEVVF